VKSYIVTKDERETGLRNLVNFGHTIGHAIEAFLAPDMLHGECVSIGMVLEAQVARALGKLSNAAVGRLERCLRSYDLPVGLGDTRVKGCRGSGDLTVQGMLKKMSVDKKNVGNKKKMVLLAKIGKCVEERASTVEDGVIERVLAPNVMVKSPLSSFSHRHDVVLKTPGSKSISNRALLLAGLGEGKCRLDNLLHSDDTAVMMNALEVLGGVRFEWVDDGESVIVYGGGGRLLVSAFCFNFGLCMIVIHYIHRLQKMGKRFISETQEQPLDS
jgi:pentafunctional AROM polypeptide